MQVSNPPPAPAKPKGLGQILGRVTVWFSRLPSYLQFRRAVACPRCKTDLANRPLYRRLRVCDVCGYHFPLSAHDRIQALVDSRTFHAFQIPQANDTPDLRRIRRATHLREAILTGTANLGECSIVIAAFDFRFQGGSMSMAVGEAMTQAFEFAMEHRLSVVAIISTGGVRIQEGMPALLQMAKTTQAAQVFQRTGKPFIAVLCNPTTGGVFASFANLADILLAEPGAVIGFAGPRVAETLTKTKLPPDSHHAESAYANGMIDAIMPREKLRATLERILALTAVSATPSSPESLIAQDAPVIAEPSTELDAWETVARVRRADRPTALDYIPHLFSDFIELHGDRLHGDDPALVAGLGRFENQAVMVIAQERGHGDEHHHGSASAEGYRKAERLMRLAEHFALPIITLIDTPGADPGFESERGGIANAIAQCLAALIQIRVPTVALVIGEGTSGGALALAVTDRVLMMEHATLTVISPEGASAILFGDAAHAAETAKNLGLDARDLLRRGIVDALVPEPGEGAHTQPQVAIESLKNALRHTLVELQSQNGEARLQARSQRYRRAERDVFSPKSKHKF